MRCVGVYKSKRNCKSASHYPCTAKRRTWVVAGLKKAGTAAMHRTLMLYVNEIGFYALNEKYSAENLLVNILATAKRGSKVLGSLRRMETEQNEPNRCSLSTRADYMLFEPFQNVQQLRFVGVARKGNNLILLHNPTKKHGANRCAMPQ